MKNNLLPTFFKTQVLYQMKRLIQRFFIFVFDLNFDLINKKAQRGKNEKNRTTLLTIFTRTQQPKHEEGKEYKKRKRSQKINK